MVVELVSRLKNVLTQITEDYEIILVEDCGPDQSWKQINEVCKTEPKVKGVKLSRNFGQHYAITCGLQLAKGEWVVVMDCDLQDQPEEIPNLIEKANEGYDLVFAQRIQRQDSFLKGLSSRMFYRFFSYLTDTYQDETIANFGIYNKKVIESVLSMNDSIRYFPTMVQWVGFNSSKLPVEHSSRSEGKSSYTFSALMKLAFNNIVSFSDKPLRLLIKFGFVVSVLSFLAGIWYFFQFLSGKISVLGFTSIIITITFLSGIIILTLGLVGVYVGKSFEQSKGRPIFIIDQQLNFDE